MTNSLVCTGFSNVIKILYPKYSKSKIIAAYRRNLFMLLRSSISNNNTNSCQTP